MQNGFLKNIKERIDRYFTDVIPKRIAAGEALIRNIERDIRPPCEIRKQCHRVEMEVMPIYGRIILAYVDLFEEKVVPLTDIRALSLPSSNLRQSCETELSVEGQWIPVHVSKITCASDDKDKCAELAEIYLLRKYRHQNIVEMFGFSARNESNGKMFHIFTELCDKNLEDKILSERLSWQSRVRYLEDVIKGIEYLHQSGLVHKNIRLSTILIKGNEAKLSSCGITEKVAEGLIEGVPIVRAPEVYLESYCGCESDIFQFGVVLWETCYRRRAFCEGKWSHITNYSDFMNTMVNGERPEFTEVYPQPLLVNIAESCWQLDPNVRPSAKKVLVDLGKCLICL